MTATSTLTEPESQRNTCSSPSGASAASRSARVTAGSCVSPPNITWLIRPSCSLAAASSAGCAYPCSAAHHDDMPSISSAPSASRSRTPLASATTSGGYVPGIGAYGCQTRCLSSSSSFSWESMERIIPNVRGWLSAAYPRLAAGFAGLPASLPRFSRTRMVTLIGVPSKPNSSRSRRSMNRR